MTEHKELFALELTGMKANQIELLHNPTLQEYLCARLKHPELRKTFELAPIQKMMNDTEVAAVRAVAVVQSILFPPDTGLFQAWFAITTASLRVWHYLFNPNATSKDARTSAALTDQLEDALEGLILDPSMDLLAPPLLQMAEHAFKAFINFSYALLLDPDSARSKRDRHAYWTHIEEEGTRHLSKITLLPGDTQTPQIIAAFPSRVRALRDSSFLVPLWHPTLEVYLDRFLIRSNVGARAVRRLLHPTSPPLTPHAAARRNPRWRLVGPELPAQKPRLHFPIRRRHPRQRHHQGENDERLRPPPCKLPSPLHISKTDLPSSASRR